MGRWFHYLLSAIVIATASAAGAQPLISADLDTRIARILAKVPAGAKAGVKVIDASTGTILASHNAAAALIPASTLKLAISAAALIELGGDFRFSTKVVGLGPLLHGGLPGLGIIGGGSPALDEHFTEKKPDEIFVAWALQLRAAGITRIDGNLVIDGRLFSGPIRPATYPSGLKNAISWFSAPASAFAWNDNCIEVRVVPTTPGSAARVEVRPNSPRIAVVNRTRTVTTNADEGITLTRAAGSNTITVSGAYRLGTAWNPVAIHSDPDLLAGDHCKAVFADNGIAISGAVTRGDVDPAAHAVLIDHRDALLPVLTIMNQRSQNFYGEQLLRMVSTHRQRPGSVTDGIAVATAIMQETLGQNHGFRILDGSGLSYGNRASANGMAQLLMHMHQHYGATFAATLKPVAAGTGTALIKTGSLAVASALAGYVDPPGGGARRVFVLLFNAADDGGIEWAAALRQRILAEIAVP